MALLTSKIACTTTYKEVSEATHLSSSTRSSVSHQYHRNIASRTHITCKLRPLCLLIGYTNYYTKGYTESYLFFSACAFALVFLYCNLYGTCSSTNGLFRHLRTSRGSLIPRRRVNTLGRLLEEVDEGFSRIACLFHLGVGSMGKGTCFGHMRH